MYLLIAGGYSLIGNYSNIDECKDVAVNLLHNCINSNIDHHEITWYKDIDGLKMIVKDTKVCLFWICENYLYNFWKKPKNLFLAGSVEYPVKNMKFIMKNHD